jgi:Zn-finger nucleic acid-binding protein
MDIGVDGGLMVCPKCSSPLKTVRVGLHPPVIGTGSPPFIPLDVAQCGNCAGVWFQRGSLERYLDEHGDSLPEKPMLPSRLHEFDEKVADCPFCRVRMEQRGAGKDAEVRVDHCGCCGGYWLDDGEVQRLTECGRPGDALLSDTRSRLERIFGGWLPFARH